MDIAAIRKKAKTQKRPVDTQPEPVKVQVPELPDERSESQAQVDDVAKANDSSSAVGLHLPATLETVDGADRLDQLFAVVEEFALTSDMTAYTELLDNQPDTQSEISRQYLAFHLGQEEYALDIRRISEIIKVREFTAVPRAPEFVLGIISLRGVVVPVFDLRRRLNLGMCDRMSTTRIVVCQLDDVAVGLQVDSINQVVDLIDEEIEPPPGVLSGLDREMLSGIGRYQGRMIILLNLRSVLDVGALN
jgi:purine-binding chemotaxis protein CheW